MRRMLLLGLLCMLVPFGASAADDQAKKKKKSPRLIVNVFTGRGISSPVRLSLGSLPICYTAVVSPITITQPFLPYIRKQFSFRNTVTGFSFETRLWKLFYVDNEFSYARSRHNVGDAATVYRWQYRTSQSLRVYLTRRGRVRLYIGGGPAFSVERYRLDLPPLFENTSLRTINKRFGLSFDTGGKTQLWRGLCAGYQAKYFHMGDIYSLSKARVRGPVLSTISTALPGKTREHRATISWEF